MTPESVVKELSEIIKQLECLQIEAEMNGLSVDLSGLAKAAEILDQVACSIDKEPSP